LEQFVMCIKTLGVMTKTMTCETVAAAEQGVEVRLRSLVDCYAPVRPAAA